MKRRIQTRTRHRRRTLHQNKGKAPRRGDRVRSLLCEGNMGMTGMAPRISMRITTDSQGFPPTRDPLPPLWLPRPTRCRQDFRKALNVVCQVQSQMSSHLSPQIRASRLKAIEARKRAQPILMPRCIHKLPRFRPSIIHGYQPSQCRIVARHHWNCLVSMESRHPFYIHDGEALSVLLHLLRPPLLANRASLKRERLPHRPPVGASVPGVRLVC
jgi:hypothetical protein